MNLGDLEFKAEDFPIVIGRFAEVDTQGRQMIADHANRILKEKLEKVPKVFGLHYQVSKYTPMYCNWTNAGSFDPPLFSWRRNMCSDTHTARLVCIEEIRK